MARIRHSTSEKRLPVDGWSLLTSEAGAFATPLALADQAGWCIATVPGSVAGALRENGTPVQLSGVSLDERDHWYRTRLHAPLDGCLVFEGLATLCEIWIDGIKRAESRSMFQPVSLDVMLQAGSEIVLCFRALAPQLAAAPRRSRWRPGMIQPNGLRWFRTTALGSMPGWCPPGRPIGPWRPIESTTRTGAGLTSLDIASCIIRSSLDGTSGQVDIRIVLRPGVEMAEAVRVRSGEIVADLSEKGAGVFEGRLTVPDARLWFPHTHGEPALYPLSFETGGIVFDLGHVGFRALEVDRGADGKGFGLIVNGVPVFCRGASWSNADVTTLPGDRASYEPWLRRAQEAGMNMLRVAGVMTYESEAFFDLCDELGIMVWQDMMLANFDYPQGDAGFVAAVQAEAEHLLNRTQTAPSLVVLCGGSEVFQQAAMLGAPPETWSGPIFDEILPAAVGKLRPDIVYVPNSPSGGALPFIANEGVTHYYGVGAYMRPLDDARRANVRFAAECLAFANVPEEASLVRGNIPGILHHPTWKQGVPRDVGASWDFDDVRDHYLEQLYGVSALHLRRDDPERYFTLSRAVTAEVMEATYAEWRRPGSGTSGALVWFLQDIAPGAGWGVIGADGVPKSSYFALARAFKPVHLGVTDEGVNGLALHVTNEHTIPLSARLTLTCWREGATPLVKGVHEMTIAPRSAASLSAFDLLDGFFDITYAYRFGPPAHDVTSLALMDLVTGAVLGEAFHFPQGRGNSRSETGLSVQLDQKDGRHFLLIETRRFAQSVHIVDDAFQPSDNWFHLAPGTIKRIELHGKNGKVPSGEVRAVNAWDRVRYGE